MGSDETPSKSFDPDVIRTRSLLIWSQTRYRCATESDEGESSNLPVRSHSGLAWLWWAENIDISELTSHLSCGQALLSPEPGQHRPQRHLYNLNNKLHWRHRNNLIRIANLTLNRSCGSILYSGTERMYLVSLSFNMVRGYQVNDA